MPLKYVAIQTKQLQNKKTQDTADFLNFINKRFDCLNSGTLISNNPDNYALNSFRCWTSETYLIKASTYFKNMHKCKKENMTGPPHFNVIIKTINGILNLFK